MFRFGAPRVLSGGRWWTDDAIAAIASRWHSFLDSAPLKNAPLLVAALPTSHEGVALFLALISRPVPIVLLSHNSSTWPATLAGLGRTPLLLTGSLAELSGEARARGCDPLILPDGDPTGDAARSFELVSPEFVLFTSGSTGAAKAVSKTWSSLFGSAETRADVLGLPHGRGCLTGVPLATGQALNLMASSLLRAGPIGLLSPFDHRAALAAIREEEFGIWWASPHFADVLSRCALTAPPAAPALCLASSPVSRRVFDAFRARFGVPLRQAYSSTETGPVTVDAAPAQDVVHGSVGRPLPGIELRIEEAPANGDGNIGGRIWIRTPYLMRGYGIPPDVAAPEFVDGFWPTRDLGRLDADGRLWLCGRIDDCVRTGEGRLVSTAEVEARIRELEGVRAVAVVGMSEGASTTLGAVVERLEAQTGSDHAWLLRELPSWARPRKLTVVPSLPRLPNGKVDRRACAALLAGASE